MTTYFFCYSKNYYMGLLRRGGKFLGKIIFTSSIAFLIITMGLVEFTEYSNMKASFSGILGSAGGIESDLEDLPEEYLEGLYQRLLEMCEGQETIQIDTEESQSVTIDCNSLRSAEDAEGSNLTTVISGIITAPLFDSIYYKEYECEFLECMQTGQFLVLFSEQGHEFFVRIQIYLALGVAVGIVIIILLSENWPERLKGLGWPLVFTGISYFIFELGKLIIADSLGEEVGVSMASMVDSMFGPMINNFLIALVAGIALVSTGYVLAYKAKKKKKVTKKKK
jgi:hypothetical protein